MAKTAKGKKEEPWEAKRRKEIQEIVDKANDFARQVYAMHGNVVPDGYKFYEATHPQETACWAIAVAAADHYEGTDVTDALNELQEEDDG